VYFKKELVRRLIAQALQSTLPEFFEGFANVLECVYGSKDC